MKIIKLQSENFKKIKAVEIVPKDHTVIISGENGQGKTSILDSIFVALCGKKQDLIKPIRDGETSSHITVELDQYFVTRSFKQGSSKLEVISKGDGEIMSSPQALLDNIVGSLTFDPLSFANLKDKEQRELLLKLIKIDLKSWDDQQQELYNFRHDVGVTMKSLPEITFSEKAEAEKICHDGRVDSTTLMNEMAVALAQRQTYTLAKLQTKMLHEEIAKLTQTIDNLTAEKLKKIDELAITEKVQDTNYNFEETNKKINEAQIINDRFNEAENIIKNWNRHEDLQSRYNTYTARLESLDKDKRTALAAAKMPIDGLEVSDDGITFNKIPFSQLSSAEKLKVSMAIAMAMNPELRVIRILDGSLLDDTNMEVIREMAQDGDYQVWIERVDSSGKVGFYIEEGEVAANNYACHGEIDYTVKNFQNSSHLLNPTFPTSKI